MSGFGAPGGRAQNIKPTPPERGSFPLDHDAECKHLISSYLRCLKSQNPPGKNNEECRQLARGYLGCRMEKGLMAKDEWRNLGFGLKEEDMQDLREKGIGGDIGSLKDMKGEERTEGLRTQLGREISQNGK